MLAVIVPTFKEPLHVRFLSEALRVQTFADFSAVFINSNPGDETSSYLDSVSDNRFVELQANPDVYWTEAMHMGITWARNHLEGIEYFLFLNSDVHFEPSFLQEYVSAGQRHRQALLCAATRNRSRYISSGVRMKSWILSLTSHHIMGKRKKETPLYIPVDMLAGRAQLVPVSVIDAIGTPNYRMLPHYGADYEFSARARRHGYRLFVYTGVEVELDAKNTGRKSYFKNTTLSQRFRYLFDIRSPMNLKYRFNFTRLVYPKGARVIGLITVLLKTLMEALFGRSAHRLLRPKRVRG